MRNVDYLENSLSRFLISSYVKVLLLWQQRIVHLIIKKLFMIFAKTLESGTDVMIFKIFSPKNLAKELAFFTQNKATFFKI
jgi:hypothetical protein